MDRRRILQEFLQVVVGWLQLNLEPTVYPLTPWIKKQVMDRRSDPSERLSVEGPHSDSLRSEVKGCVNGQEPLPEPVVQNLRATLHPCLGKWLQAPPDAKTCLTSRAMPKSLSLQCQSASNKKLLLLMSRWISCWLCKYSSASAPCARYKQE